MFTAACGYLGAVYLTGEAQRRDDASLQAYFTRRAQAAATTAGAPHATLAAIIWLAVATVLTVGPSYALLLTLQGRQVLRAGQTQGTSPIGPGTRRLPAAGSSGQHRQSPLRQARGSRATTVGFAALTCRRNR